MQTASWFTSMVNILLKAFSPIFLFCRSVLPPLATLFTEIHYERVPRLYKYQIILRKLLNLKRWHNTYYETSTKK